MNNTDNQEIIINREFFSDFYFKEEEQFNGLIRRIWQYQMAKAALVRFKTGNPTFDMVENGISYYRDICERSMSAAMKELKFLSNLSRMLYKKSMVSGIINTENVRECYRIIDDISNIMHSDAGIDAISLIFG